MSYDGAIRDGVLYAIVTGSIDEMTVRRLGQDLRNPSRPVVLSIDSGGGVLAEGLTAYHMLIEHGGYITTVIEGQGVASIASILALAGDRRLIRPGAEIMIHEASAERISGNSAKLAEASRVADAWSAGLARTYAERCGGSAARWRERMHAETRFTAAEAVAAGLCHEIVVEPAPSTVDRIASVHLGGHPAVNRHQRLVFAADHRRNVSRPEPKPSILDPQWKARTMALAVYATVGFGHRPRLSVDRQAAVELGVRQALADVLH